MPFLRPVLVAGACTVLGWVVSLVLLGAMLEEPSPPSDLVIGLLLMSEVFASLTSAVLLVSFQRSRSLHTGLPLVVLGSLTGAAAPAGVVAFVQLVARRDSRVLALVLVTMTAAVLAQDEAMVRLGADDDPLPWWQLLIALVVLEMVLVLIGLVIGHRRALLESLRNEVTSASRERDLVVARANTEERHRIAGEMHDTLAHHLGLISLHAGALGRRDDLPPETVRETSRTVAELSRTAADELRTLLGVLHTEPSTAAPPPGVTAIPALVDQHRRAVAVVSAELLPALVDGDVTLPEQASRLFYLAAQQCLSNAARHAPGAPVALSLESDAEGVRLLCRNPMPVRALTGPSTGIGLPAMAERTRLAGGRQTAGRCGEEFVVEVFVPW